MYPYDPFDDGAPARERRSPAKIVITAAITLAVLAAFIVLPLLTTVFQPSPHVTNPQPAAAPLTGTRGHRVHQIERQTAGLRGLKPLHPVRVVFLHNHGFNHRISSFYNSGQSRHDIRISHIEGVMVGMYARSINLMRILTGGLTQEVVGLYDNKTKRLYIRDNGTALTLDRWTVAHEYTHALQDQHFALKRVDPDQTHWPYKDSDASLAEHSLIEGDAVHVQYAYLTTYYTQAQIQALQQQLNGYHTAPVPAIINEAFQFPYTDGPAYIDHLLQQGGYPAVNHAFRHPPTTTHALMFPGSVIHPTAITIHHVLGRFKSWKVADDDVNGAFGYYQMVEKYVPRTEAMELAKLWRGDRYVLLRSKGRNLMYLRSAYGNGKAARTAEGILRSSLATRFHATGRGVVGGQGTWADTARAGRFVTLTYAPTPPLASAVLHAATR